MSLNRTILKQAMKARIVFDIKIEEIILFSKNVFSRKVDFKMTDFVFLKDWQYF